ncbi:unnamed protein product [Thelazia callipaeda]|uniref:Protein-cysteine N-palmitoyltransferase HHAT n=1 Tax=Thelazia callipaeda TaxID=103827 RepID=A0A0N5CM84_THECL|nr:unnamed protein product [Thelazia callipaeda]
MSERRNTTAHLPKMEILFYSLVWIVHSLLALYIAWNSSVKFRLHLFLEPSKFINGLQQDGTDSEWSLYSKSLSRILITSISHTGTFSIYIYVIDDRIQHFFSHSKILFQKQANFSTTCTITVSILAALMAILAYYCRKELIFWLIIITFMVKINLIIHFNDSIDVHYREFNYYLYSAIKILNFCIHLSRNKDTNITSSLLYRYAQYLFYPPYAIILIVLFNDFDTQMTEIEKGYSKSTNYRDLLQRLVRIILWFIVFEAILHVIHVHAIFATSPIQFNNLSEYEIASIAYINGKLFYMKYLLIFGIPSWFASIDGMKPPAGPVCISRISKYSQMWRSFDRGLYLFLKHQVYIPIVSDPSSKLFTLRRFVAMITVFLFVLAWHGTSSNYICWVLLNALEICIEWLGSAICATTFYNKLREFLGPRGERRLIAIAMLSTVVPGIFGVFFFLSRQKIGMIIFERLFLNLVLAPEYAILNLSQRSFRLAAMALHFLFLGYCYNHVCLELEKYFTSKSLEEKAKQKEL